MYYVKTLASMLLRTLTIFLITSVVIVMAVTKPTITIDVSYEMLNELTKVTENLEVKKQTVLKVKRTVQERVNALPDKDAFLKEVNNIAKELNVSPALLLIKFYIESRINPAIAHKTSGASGIYQAMHFALPEGVTAEQFRKLSATEQLKHYRTFIMPMKKYIRPGHIEDLYVANLCPRALIKGQETLYKYPSKEYMGNKGLDINNDKKITRTDIRKVIERYLIEDK